MPRFSCPEGHPCDVWKRIQVRAVDAARGAEPPHWRFSRRQQVSLEFQGPFHPCPLFDLFFCWVKQWNTERYIYIYIIVFIIILYKLIYIYIQLYTYIIIPLFTRVWKHGETWWNPRSLPWFHRSESAAPGWRNHKRRGPKTNLRGVSEWAALVTDGLRKNIVGNHDWLVK